MPPELRDRSTPDGERSPPSDGAPAPAPADVGGRPVEFAPVKLDPDRIAAAGLRTIEGRHLTLATDLPTAPEIDELPAVFDQAVAQWADYFQLPAERWKSWRLVGCLMQSKERFELAGLWNARLPPFTQGYQEGLQIWLYEQPTAYYRRHLLLHEGTHAVLSTLVGGSGPPWYAEGMSELLATHRWADGRLTLRTLPASRDESPGWGRIKIVRDDYSAGRGKALEDVMRYGPDAHLQVEPYGWCWAISRFYDDHPKTQKPFRELRRDVHDPSLDFSRRFYQTLKPDWADLTEDWQLFVSGLEYGYDLSRNLVERKPGRALPDEGATVKVAVDRGWQSTGWRLEANRAYEFTARGRYRLAAKPEEWSSEAGGVTLRYHQGKPLGLLLGAIRPDLLPPGALTPLATPDEIGLGRGAVIEQTGTLYVKINDAPGELADNAGELTLEIRPVAAGPTITNRPPESR